jgi:hypothetical protein
MYELLSAASGIGLYFLSSRASTSAAIALVVVILVAGVVGVVVGGYVGARRPGAAAAAPWFWSLALFAAGAGVAWAAIAASTRIIAARGAEPNPGVEAAASAAIVVVGLVVARQVKLAELCGATWATKQMLRMRYGARYAVFPASEPLDHPMRLAYQAVRDEAFNAGSEPVRGWGFSARRLRFQLIARAGRAPAQPSS